MMMKVTLMMSVMNINKNKSSKKKLAQKKMKRENLKTFNAEFVIKNAVAVKPYRLILFVNII